MVYFVVIINYNEIVQIQKNLPSHTYCLFQSEGSQYYGAVDEISYQSLLHTLTAETLENLEYLNEEEFSRFISSRKTTNCIGSNRVIAKFINV
jgi:hypothetical protein